MAMYYLDVLSCHCTFGEELHCIVDLFSVTCFWILGRRGVYYWIPTTAEGLVSLSEIVRCILHDVGTPSSSVV